MGLGKENTLALTDWLEPAEPRAAGRLGAPGRRVPAAPTPGLGRAAAPGFVAAAGLGAGLVTPVRVTGARATAGRVAAAVRVAAVLVPAAVVGRMPFLLLERVSGRLACTGFVGGLIPVGAPPDMRLAGGRSAGGDLRFPATVVEAASGLPLGRGMPVTLAGPGKRDAGGDEGGKSQLRRHRLLTMFSCSSAMVGRAVLMDIITRDGWRCRRLLLWLLVDADAFLLNVDFAERGKWRSTCGSRVQ